MEINEISKIQKLYKLSKNDLFTHVPEHFKNYETMINICCTKSRFAVVRFDLSQNLCFFGTNQNSYCFQNKDNFRMQSYSDKFNNINTYKIRARSFFGILTRSFLLWMFFKSCDWKSCQNDRTVIWNVSSCSITPPLTSI